MGVYFLQKSCVGSISDVGEFIFAKILCQVEDLTWFILCKHLV